MNSDIRDFVYLSCDDMEDWEPGEDIDYWIEPSMCRFRKKYEDGVNYIHYMYDTVTLDDIGKLCMKPVLFWSDYPETVMGDLISTVKYILEQDWCVTFTPGDHMLNTKFMEIILDQVPGAKIGNIKDEFSYMVKE